jgi:hypothetical protein
MFGFQQQGQACDLVFLLQTLHSTVSTEVGITEESTRETSDETNASGQN